MLPEDNKMSLDENQIKFEKLSEMKDIIKLENFSQDWQSEIIDIPFSDLEKSSQVWREHGMIGLLIWNRLNCWYQRYETAKKRASSNYTDPEAVE